MESIVKIGIMGCGWIADFAHLPALSQIEKVKVEALFDIQSGRGKSLGEKWKVSKVYSDMNEFFDSGIDAVIIATPNATHVPFSLEALKRGIHVLCEKPVAFTAEEIEQIQCVAKEHNVLYIPGFVNRWREDIQKVYGLLREGAVGQIQDIQAGWLRRRGVPRPGTWFTNKQLSGGGVLVDLGSHVMDICLLFLEDLKPSSYKLYSSICDGEKMKTAGGAEWFKRADTEELSLDVEDSVAAYVEFEENVHMEVKLSWLAPVEGDCTYFKIKGTEGEIYLKTLFGFSNDRMWSKDSLKVSGKKNFELVLNEDRLSAKNAFCGMLRYFVNAVISRNTDFTNVEDALKNVSLIEQLYKIEEHTVPDVSFPISPANKCQ